jgi:MFS family permease
MASAAAATDTRSKAGARTLVVLLTGQTMASMDLAMVNVAAPSIHVDLGASGAQLQLVLAAYLLSYAVAVPAGARVGIRVGPREAFVAGLAVFAAASLACGCAPGPWSLVAALAIQGLGGALMVPQVLSLIQLTFTGDARTRAVGFYSLVLSLGVLAGQSIGGALVSADLLGLGWRPIFLVNVPAAVIVALLGWRDLPRLPATRAAQFDGTGVALLGASMLLLLVPLVFGRESGWPWWTWALLAAGLVGAAAFAQYELRRARRGAEPVLDLSVLADGRVAAGGVALCTAMGVYAGLVLALTLHMQEALGFSPLRSGATIACYAAGFAVSSLTWRRVCARIGLRYVVVGYLGFACGALVLALLPHDRLGPETIAVLVYAGWCHAVTFAPLFNHLTTRVDARNAGDLSALLSTSVLLAEAASIAGLGSIYFAAASSGAGVRLVALAGALALAGAAPLARFAVSAPTGTRGTPPGRRAATSRGSA